MTAPTTPNGEPVNVHEAILRVMADVPYIQRTDRNAHQGYMFVGEAALIRHIHPSLVAHGLTFCVTEIDTVKCANTTTNSGKPAHHLIAIYGVTITHAASGSSVTIKALGESIDTQDKSASQAATIAYKYALRHAFCIQTGDDPDANSPRTDSRPVVESDLFGHGSSNKEEAEREVARSELREIMTPADAKKLEDQGFDLAEMSAQQMRRSAAKLKQIKAEQTKQQETANV